MVGTAPPAARKRPQEWVREALYDLNTDPGEMKNRAFDPDCAGRLQEGRGLLKRWHAEHQLELDPEYVVQE